MFKHDLIHYLGRFSHETLFFIFFKISIAIVWTITYLGKLPALQPDIIWSVVLSGWLQDGCFRRYVASEAWLVFAPTLLVQACQSLVVCSLRSIDDLPFGLVDVVCLVVSMAFLVVSSTPSSAFVE